MWAISRGRSLIGRCLEVDDGGKDGEDVGSSEEGDAGGETVAYLEELAEKDDDESGRDELPPPHLTTGNYNGDAGRGALSPSWPSPRTSSALETAKDDDGDAGQTHPAAVSAFSIPPPCHGFASSAPGTTIGVLSSPPPSEPPETTMTHSVAVSAFSMPSSPSPRLLCS
jgi:hypothetical protein